MFLQSPYMLGLLRFHRAKTLVSNICDPWPECKINPGDNQDHPDLDFYSLLFLWCCGHLFQLLTYRVLTQRPPHPKHSWLDCSHVCTHSWSTLRFSQGRQGRDGMQRSLSPCEPYKICGKRFRKTFGRLLLATWWSKQASSDSRRMSLLDKGRRDATKAFCFWKWSRNLLQQSPNRWICFRDCYLLRRLWRSCAGHLHNFATMIKNKRKV